MLIPFVKKYLYSPINGLTPLALYSILQALILQQIYAIGISLFFSILMSILSSKLLKRNPYSLILYISAVSLLLTLILHKLTINHTNNSIIYFMFCELWIIIFILALKIGKHYILTRKLFNETYLHELFHFSTLILYLLSGHLLFALFYIQMKPELLIIELPDFVVFNIPVLFIIVILKIYELSKIKLESKELLPIVSDKGEVTGKIAKSISLKMKKKNLHPIVRVALICDNRIYLQERDANDILNPKKLDYPFEKYMLFGHESNLSAHNSIIRVMGNNQDVSPKFLMKYIFENNNVKRLVFLFTLNIENDSCVKEQEKMNGRFWTISEIQKNRVNNIFGECFELEFEYLKNILSTENKNNIIV